MNRSKMRRKLSGHWGGNENIEKVYGQSLKKRKDKILEYILDGYTPGSDKEFHDRDQQTDISLIEGALSSIRKDSTPFIIESDEKPKAKATPKVPKKSLSEIHFNYEKKKLTCYIFHLLKKRRLQIPLKSLKKQPLRVVISPPFMEMHLGHDQIYPFDLKNVLAQKQKCPFEELKREGVQRMPEVITLQPDNDWRYAEFDRNIPSTGVTVLEAANDEDFIFQDRYNYLPHRVQNKHSKMAFNFKKLTYVEPNQVKCLQKNLTNINHPERFICEKDIAETINYHSSTKSSLTKSIKTFLSGVQVKGAEVQKTKYDYLLDDSKSKEDLNITSCDRFESILPSSEPSVISCPRTYDSVATPNVVRRYTSDEKMLETDGSRLWSSPGITEKTLEKSKSIHIDVKNDNGKHKRLKSSLKRRLTETFADFSSDVTLVSPSMASGIFKNQKKIMATLWPKPPEPTTTIKITEPSEVSETVKNRGLSAKPSSGSVLATSSYPPEADRSSSKNESPARWSLKEQKFGRSKSILKRAKRRSSFNIDDVEQTRIGSAESSYPKKDSSNKEKEHILADLSLEDKFKNAKKKETNFEKNKNSTTSSNRQSAFQEGAHLIEMMFGGSLFRYDKDSNSKESKEQIVEPSTSKSKSRDKEQSASLPPENKNSTFKHNESSDESRKSVVFDNTTKSKSMKTEDKKTKSSMKCIPVNNKNDDLSNDSCTTAGSSRSQNCKIDNPEHKVLSPLFHAVSLKISSHENNSTADQADPVVADKYEPIPTSNSLLSSSDGPCDNEELTLKYKTDSPTQNRPLSKSKKEN